jgi:Fe(3+) dicitrate transport protein
MIGYGTFSKTLNLKGEDINLTIFLSEKLDSLSEITIKGELEKGAEFGLARLSAVDGVAIYESKKNEVILMKDIAANLSVNSARQVFAKVAGLNIWESDAGGLQIGIGARGLSPKRSSEFNMRQNGCDMSADALGYPDAYYTPPTEAVERIEVVRGAASLQYGPQFGGMVNFVMRKPPADKKIEWISRITGGSFGLLNIFNSVGGKLKKFSYYAFYQHKNGNGWRAESQFNYDMAFANLKYDFSPKVSFAVELTKMHYLTKQAGGLTDAQFEQNPRMVLRHRNWFGVNWNMAAAVLDVKISDRTKLNWRTFGLYAGRQALGYLAPPNRTDTQGNRDFLSDIYGNYGSEMRILKHYKFKKQTSVLLLGARYYRGHLNRKQGEGTKGADADFYYLNPENLEGSAYIFPSENISLFAENIFNISELFSITPGVRFENIKTASEGYYRERNFDLAGNVILDRQISDSKKYTRSFILTGIGASFKPSEDIEIYTNFSQNYRAVNFNDLRVNNPNLRINENLQDEKGFNADLGVRGSIGGFWAFDASLFLLSYQNRIGTILRADTTSSVLYRYRTNISDSRNIGLETFTELNVSKLFLNSTTNFISVFVNFTLLDARYLGSQEAAFKDKKVELVPNVLLRSGITYKRKNLTTSLYWSYTGAHFTDATNAEKTANGVNGIVPAYQVADFSLKYSFGKFAVESGINNIFDKMYFTRRADAYPGPGIIPSDGRSFYCTLQVKLSK